MKAFLAILALVAVPGLWAQEGENGQTESPEGKTQQAQIQVMVPPYTGPLFVKIVGGLGMGGTEPAHPSSRCEVSEAELTLHDHDWDEEGWHTTLQRSKEVNGEDEKRSVKLDLDELKAKIKEATEEEFEEDVKTFAKPFDPSVHYVAVTVAPVEREFHGQKIPVPTPQYVPLYLLDGSESVRTGPATDWLIEKIDSLCPNSKPKSELTPEGR